MSERCNFHLLLIQLMVSNCTVRLTPYKYVLIAFSQVRLTSILVYTVGSETRFTRSLVHYQ